MTTTLNDRIATDMAAGKGTIFTEQGGTYLVGLPTWGIGSEVYAVDEDGTEHEIRITHCDHRGTHIIATFEMVDYTSLTDRLHARYDGRCQSCGEAVYSGRCEGCGQTGTQGRYHM